MTARAAFGPRSAARLTVLVAAMLAALPSCITASLWSDNRTRQRGDGVRVRPPLVDATGPGYALVFDAAGTGLAAVVPDLAADACWVRLEPTAHGESLRTVLAEGDGRRGCTLEYLREQAPGVERFVLRLWLGIADHVPDGWTELPGVRQRFGLKAWVAELVVPCQPTAGEAPPADAPSAGVARFHVVPVTVADDDQPVVVKVLLTPVAALFDVVLLPWELLTISRWW